MEDRDRLEQAANYQAEEKTAGSGDEAHRQYLKNELLKEIRKYINSKEVTYEFSADPKYLQQYYDLRERCYREVLGLREFSGAEDDYDRSGHIIIARQKDRVVGGGRINGCTPQKPIPLVLEEDGFRMQEIFPEMHLEKERYCEFSRLVVSPEFRITTCLEELIEHMTNFAISCHYHYLFTVSPLIQARVYRRIHRKMGFNYDILQKVEVPCKPIYGGIKMYLSRSVLVPAVDVEK